MNFYKKGLGDINEREFFRQLSDCEEKYPLLEAFVNSTWDKIQFILNNGSNLECLKIDFMSIEECVSFVAKHRKKNLFDSIYEQFSTQLN
jgi:hypothetical protein